MPLLAPTSHPTPTRTVNASYWARKAAATAVALQRSESERKAALALAHTTAIQHMHLELSLVGALLFAGSLAAFWRATQKAKNEPKEQQEDAAEMLDTPRPDELISILQTAYSTEKNGGGTMGALGVSSTRRPRLTANNIVKDAQKCETSPECSRHTDSDGDGEGCAVGTRTPLRRTQHDDGDDDDDGGAVLLTYENDCGEDIV